MMLEIEGEQGENYQRYGRRSLGACLSSSFILMYLLSIDCPFSSFLAMSLVGSSSCCCDGEVGVVWGRCAGDKRCVLSLSPQLKNKIK